MIAFAGAVTAAAQHVGPVTGIAVAEDAVYSCSQAGIVVSETGDGKSDACVLFRPSFRVTSIAAARGILFVGGGVPGESGMVGVYDLNTGGFSEVKVGNDLVYSVDIASSGKLGAAACADNRVLTVALPALNEKGISIEHRHTSAARVVCFSPDDKWLASGGLDGAVLLSRAGEGDEAQVLQDHSAKVESLAFAPDGAAFASGARDGRVRVHDVSGRLLRTYQGMGEDDEEAVDPSILSLAWGGGGAAGGFLVAGTVAGDLYRLSTVDDRWSLIDGLRMGPVFSLAFSKRETFGVYAGTIAETVVWISLGAAK